MEGKLKAILRVSLALTMTLSLGLLVAFPVGADNGPWIFESSGPFQVPAGVTSITVEAWGAGGAGGGSTNAGFLSGRCGGGGGGGAYARSTLSVEEGQVLQVVVGEGGSGVSGGDGDKGDPSFVGPDTDPGNALVLAAGGSGGKANTAGGKPAGGAGGQAGDSTGDPPVLSGDPGERGATCFTSVSGAGGAGASGGGSGGASQGGAYVTADGNPGNAPGGGGGGARTSQFDGARAGGDGAKGRVVISWGETQECPTISPPTAQYDLAHPDDATTTITWNDALSVTSVRDNGTLVDPTHYTLVGSTLTILDDPYLAGKLTTVGDFVVLTITFDICAPVTFTITAIDTEEQICPTIWPEQEQYDLAEPNDVTTEITWNHASSLESVEDDLGLLDEGLDYTRVGNTLTIMNAYLDDKLTTVGDFVVLAITFDICGPVYFTITAIDTQLPVGLTGYPVNKLAVMAPWIALGTVIMVAAGLLTLRRRRA